jgi:hypothetical protein
MKNILVLTGSPRKDGNSTLLANAFIEGARTSGNEVTLFDAGKMKVNGCDSCLTCSTKGAACTFDDDFTKLIPVLERTDVIVFCTPLYYFTFPSQLKSVIDRLCFFASEHRSLKIKESVLITCGCLDDMEIFEGIIRTYELIAKYTNWHNREILTIPRISEIGDIKNTDGLERAKNIGLSIKE